MALVNTPSNNVTNIKQETRQLDTIEYKPAGWAIPIELLREKIQNIRKRLQNVGVEIDVFNANDFTYEEELGRGTEYIVHATTLHYNGIPVRAACKRVLRNSEEHIDRQLEEIYLVCVSQDPVVVTTLKVFGLASLPLLTTLHAPGQHYNNGGGQLMIVTELAQKNLLQLYQSETIPMHITLNLFSRITASLQVMHASFICHRNIKPENVLVINVARGPNGDIHDIDYRIIDLGMGLIMYVEHAIKEDINGTKGYYNAQSKSETPFYFANDMFCLGEMFALLLNSSEWLKSAEIGRVRRFITDMSSWSNYGTQLYQQTIGDALAKQNLEHSVAPPIKDMLCEMLERPGECNLSLFDVLRICRSEAGFAALALHRMIEDSDPTKKYLPDSGIGVTKQQKEESPAMHKADLTIISKICRLPKPLTSFTAAIASPGTQYPAKSRREYRSKANLNPRRVDRRQRDAKKVHISTENLYNTGLTNALIPKASEYSTLQSQSDLSMEDDSAFSSCTPTTSSSLLDSETTGSSALQPSSSTSFTGSLNGDLVRNSESAMNRNLRIERRRKSRKSQQRRLQSENMFYGDLEESMESRTSTRSSHRAMSPAAKRLRKSKSVGSKRSKISQKSAKSKSTRGTKSESNVKNTSVVGAKNRSQKKSQPRVKSSKKKLAKKRNVSVERRRNSRKM